MSTDPDIVANRRRLLKFALATMFFWLPLLSIAQEKKDSQMTSNELEPRGKALRAEIDQIYQELKKSNKIQFQNNITSTIVKYIPIGSSFEDAAVILRCAGFNVDPLPPRPVQENPPPWYTDETRFMIFGSALIESGLYFKSEAAISVTPQIPGTTNNTVKNLYGYINYTTL